MGCLHVHALVAIVLALMMLPAPFKQRTIGRCIGRATSLTSINVLPCLLLVWARHTLIRAERAGRAVTRVDLVDLLLEL